jgi:hypothetical protein
VPYGALWGRWPMSDQEVIRALQQLISRHEAASQGEPLDEKRDSSWEGELPTDRPVNWKETKKKIMILLVAALLVGGCVAQSGKFEWVIRHVQLKVEWVVHHVQGPWNPFSKKLSSCAPFSAVRWRDAIPEVQLTGTWYELISLDDVPVAEIVSFCKKSDGKFWRKSFEEDLVIVLTEMGKQGHSDAETGPLTVRRLDTGETLLLKNTAWTDANRQAILITALEAWKANGRQDPRADPNIQ